MSNIAQKINDTLKVIKDVRSLMTDVRARLVAAESPDNVVDILVDIENRLNEIVEALNKS